MTQPKDSQPKDSQPKDSQSGRDGRVTSDDLFEAEISELRAIRHRAIMQRYDLRDAMEYIRDNGMTSTKEAILRCMMRVNSLHNDKSTHPEEKRNET